jgi:hypothetical protein
MTQRITLGTHTVWEWARSPATVAEATASGVVASSCDGRPAVILVFTKPGRMTMTWTLELAST